MLETLRHDQLLGSSKVEKRRAARAEHAFSRQEAHKLTQEERDRQRAEQVAAAKNGLRAWKVQQAREALERRSAVQGQALSRARWGLVAWLACHPRLFACLWVTCQACCWHRSIAISSLSMM